MRKSKSNYIPRILYTSTVEDYKGDPQYAPKIQKEANEGESFPPEFFFIKLADSIPKKSSPIFQSNAFPKENRIDSAQTDLTAINQIKKANNTLLGLSDFSLLLYLFLNDKIPLKIMEDVANAISKNNPSLISPHNDFFKKFLNSSSSSSSSSSQNKPQQSSSLNPTQEKALKEILSMGFDEKSCLEALKANDWIVERAVNFILSGN